MWTRTPGACNCRIRIKAVAAAILAVVRKNAVIAAGLRLLRYAHTYRRQTQWRPLRVQALYGSPARAAGSGELAGLARLCVCTQSAVSRVSTQGAAHAVCAARCRAVVADTAAAARAAAARQACVRRAREERRTRGAARAQFRRHATVWGRMRVQLQAALAEELAGVNT